MNWEAIGAIGETIGAIAVVLSLIYLATQIRQNTKSSEAATRQALADGAQFLANDAVEHDDVARILQDHLDGKELKPHERFRVQARCYRDLRFWDNAHYQYRHGLLTKDEWEGFRMNLKLIFQFPIYRDYWENFQAMFSEHFQKEMNALLAEEQTVTLKEALGSSSETNPT